jgi:hypothetical protein
MSIKSLCKNIWQNVSLNLSITNIPCSNATNAIKPTTSVQHCGWAATTRFMTGVFQIT